MPIADPEARRRYQREWVAKRRADFFAGKACLRCGTAENLELDHRDPNTKITHRIWSWSQTRMLEEAEKCQVLCAVCHEDKTTANGERACGTRKPATASPLGRVG